MAYKYSKGATVQGDIKAADDAERDTLIDFGEDVIDFHTSGSSVLKISGSNVYLAAGTNLYLSGNAGIYFDSDNTRDVLIKDSDTNNMLIDGNNRVRLRADEQILIQHNFVTKVGFDFTGSGVPTGGRMSVYVPMSSSNDITASAINVVGDAEVGGNFSFEDVIMAELSITGLDLQTDSNAFRFNCPYNLELTSMSLGLDSTASANNTTVNVTNSTDGTLITATISATNDSVVQSTVTSGSRSQGDDITFEITSLQRE